MSCRWYYLRLTAYNDYMCRQEQARRRVLAQANGQAVMVFTVGNNATYGDGRNVRQCATIPVQSYQKGL